MVTLDLSDNTSIATIPHHVGLWAVSIDAAAADWDGATVTIYRRLYPGGNAESVGTISSDGILDLAPAMIGELELRVTTAGASGSEVEIRAAFGEAQQYTYDPAIVVASSMPAATPGRLVFRTDLGELFAYDGTLSKWLAPARREAFGFRGTITSDQWANYAGWTNLNTTIGPVMPYDCTVTMFSVAHQTAGPVATVYLRKNGSNVHSLSVGSGDQKVYDTSADIDYSAGDQMQVWVDWVSGSMVNPCFSVDVRRRAS